MFVRVPWESLSEEALQGVIEEFVSREGTEYGVSEVSLKDKYLQVRRQIESGEVAITYNEEDQSCTLVPARELD